MSRRITSSVIGALAAASLAAPIAHAGTPARVNVRVEAPKRTIVDTTVTTTRKQVVKDGDESHTCSGTSAAGALEVATGGDWTASWFDGLGYAVDSFGGVRGAADFSSYWTLWVNGTSSSTGVCDTELEPRDEVLEFLCVVSADFTSCENLPLAIKVRSARFGRVALTVVRLKGDGTSKPVAGATVKAGSSSVTTNGRGRATVLLPVTGGTLRATHAGDVPSATLNCGFGDGGGGCQDLDVVAPVLELEGIGDGATFAAADAPRELHGIARDRGGRASVALRLTRRAHGSCTHFDGQRAAFRRCDGRRAPRVEVGDERRWSYLLPAKLKPGRYGLLVIASDTAGNRTRVKVRFTVEDAG
jgi:hypothetical protein